MEYKDIQVIWKKRAIKIVKLHDDGWSWADIGRKFCISRQRAQQIYQQEADK